MKKILTIAMAALFCGGVASAEVSKEVLDSINYPRGIVAIYNCVNKPQLKENDNRAFVAFKNGTKY